MCVIFIEHFFGICPGAVTKKARKQATQKSEPEPEPIAIDESSNGKIGNDGAASPAPKKKKTSEIDKLLGDEGAINMLNSLNQSNSSSGEGSSPSKIPRAKPSKADTPIVSPGAAVKAKPAKPTAQKQQPNANKVKHSTPKTAPANKKQRNAKDSNDWDYVYDTLPIADCMIFRRRSNSSFSSADSLPHNSSDHQPTGPIASFNFDDIGGDDEVSKATPPPKRARNTKDDKSVDFTKPKAKKSAKGQTKIQSFFDAKPPTDEDVDNVFNNNNHGLYANNIDPVPIKLDDDTDESIAFTSLSVSRYTNFHQITLISADREADILITVQVYFGLFVATFRFYQMDF